MHILQEFTSNIAHNVNSYVEGTYIMDVTRGGMVSWE